MRLIYKKYADEEAVLFETDDKGGNPRTITGELRDRSKVGRVRIFIEVSCDNEDSVRRDAAEALDQINKQLKK